MRNSTKKIFSRTLSGLLAFLTVLTLLASMSLIPVLAEDGDGEQSSINYSEYYTNPGYANGPNFISEEARIKAMQLYYKSGDYELYADKVTGEVALKDTVTGDILFTTPYDTAEINKNLVTANKKIDLLSQVIINYQANAGEGVSSYNSFTHAALLNQIKIKRLKGGVRVEYSIGPEETRMLLPRAITEARFKEMILEPIKAGTSDWAKAGSVYSRIQAHYGLYTAFSSKVETYPILKEQNIYILHESNTGVENKRVENWIRRYCPEYTFEELDKDHKTVGYEGTETAPANFKMALEYYITANGVEVRFPANGLSFDESTYILKDMIILKYMGAGTSQYNGYTFFPDGSGALVRFEDHSSYYNFGGSIYGQDYAYQEIGNANQEVFRMPVFGVVTTNEVRSDAEFVSGQKPKSHSTGYVAIVTEGEALASIFTNHDGDQKFMYHSTYCKLTPRPQDQYNLAEVISISGSDTFTVVSDRKYTGSFKINYIMLTDPKNQVEKAGKTYYDTTYVGMAKAYREFLENKGDLTRITEAESSIPLYIEAFGATETEESILSIPITVKKALTSFEDLKAMTNDLVNSAQSPITNIAYRLTGYTNGGMKSTIPSKVKFEKATGGNSGFRDFLDFAADKGIDVYPEFDFAYMTETKSFDGFSYSEHAVKSIDDRYTTKRTYDAVLQTFSTTGKICISSSVYREMFDGFSKAFEKIRQGKTTYISAGTLGSDLNSDFDKKDPYNREDAKAFTAEMLSRFKKTYGNVMVDAGNAYTIPYASVVLNAPLDSSRYLGASESVPFFGLAFHGYVVIAGKPTNTAGDMAYEVLKIIENGATIYMMLSYDNVELLKKDEDLSKYYAVSYEIWKNKLLSSVDENGNKVIGLYEKLNTALADVQTSRINDHLFVNCKRTLMEDEIRSINEQATVKQSRYIEEYQSLLNHFVELKTMYDNLKLLHPGYTDAQIIEYVGLSLDQINAGISEYTVLLESEKSEDTLNSYKNEIISKINLDITDGSVVYVEYENGHWFLLNYNDYAVEVNVKGNGGEILKVEPKNFFDSNTNTNISYK